jgi:hypothetical protein
MRRHRAGSTDYPTAAAPATRDDDNGEQQLCLLPRRGEKQTMAMFILCNNIKI